MNNDLIQNKIHEIRGTRVMLDYDLAELYQVETKRLKEAVRRNIERFEGEDFMFELTHEEYNSLIISLRTQIATSNAREEEDTYHLLLPNKELQCYQVCLEAKLPSW